jgi:hypothetical protein
MEISANMGLGLGVPGAFAANGQKNRPSQLTLSPSDSNLVGSKAVAGYVPEEADEERGVVSEVRNFFLSDMPVDQSGKMLERNRVFYEQTSSHVGALN